MFNDWASIEIGRVRKAKDLKLININDDMTCAECKGSGKEPYIIHTSYCSCPDYRKAGYICKHMIALAAMRGELDLDALIAEDDKRIETEECKEKLSMAFANYYLFNDPDMSDSEYDELKKKYMELSGTKL